MNYLSGGPGCARIIGSAGDSGGWRMFFRIVNRLNEAGKDDTGGVAAEYGVIIAGIAVAVTIAVGLLGGRISDLFDTVLP